MVGALQTFSKRFLNKGSEKAGNRWNFKIYSIITVGQKTEKNP